MPEVKRTTPRNTAALANALATACARRPRSAFEHLERRQLMADASTLPLRLDFNGGVGGSVLDKQDRGTGFTGIAVAVMGRGHPFGIVLASLLFGALFQGGAEVSFEIPGFSRDMVVTLQGFIVLFSGAMAYVIAPWIAKLFHWGARRTARADALGASGASHG